MALSHKIRPATEKDAESVTTMVRELAEYENNLGKCRMTPEIFTRDGFGENAAFKCLIAETKIASSSAIQDVGYAIFHFTYSVHGGRTIYLEDLYVKEPQRKHGIGADLMKAVAKIGIEKGCLQFKAACYKWNCNALEFYKSAGARDITEETGLHIMRFGQNEMQILAEEK
uniref:thialysine N-epsilon-acetyltransferase-like n=1 Tax=Styela clava TaxID=7725 RepID=UPI00193A4F72|nr:thialysine N-epsilon-acetyltransferase-like [Styela clava]